MRHYRVVNYSDLQEFVDACKSFDDSFMNFTLGALLDSITATQTTRHADGAGSSSRTMLAVFDGPQLVICLVNISRDFPWMLGTPRGVEEEMSGEDITVVTSLLAPAIAAAVDLRSFDKVIGPENLVNALLETWASHVNALGIPAKLKDPLFKSRVSYATQASLPPASAAFSEYQIALATSEDVDTLIPLYIKFTAHSPHAATPEEAKRVISGSVDLGRVWVCRLEDRVAGYCAIGRNTPNTIAIRNVYVSPEYRRRGIAEALTTAITRLYLGAGPLGVGSPVSEPALGLKQEICLNVAEEHVERIYKKCGFLLDQIDPSTGKVGWFHSVFRGVEYL